MKNSKKGFLFALFVIISILPSRLCANHIVGADITWKHYSKDTFLFTASVYRSCTGMKLTNSPFTYFGTSPGYTKAISVYGSLGLTKDVTPGTYGCDQCTDPSCSYGFGIQLITEDVKIAFPAGCCDWFVSWQQNYRDGSISTGPGGQVLYVEAEINPCLSRPDNSPTFNSPANNIFCVKQCNTMDNGAKDIDGDSKNKPDSLVYSLVAPLQAHGKPVTFAKGSSYLKPMIVAKDSSVCLGFALNPNTGIIQFEPKLQEISVMAIQVDEWRADTNGNYQKIGSVRRDIETYVTDCSKYLRDQPPIIAGINGGNSFSETFCGGGQQTCFNVKAFDLDAPDTVKMSWNGPGEMKGATFTIVPDGKKWPTAVFCWFMLDSNARKLPYTFTVTAKDNKIPPDSSSKTFSVYVSPGPKAIYSATSSCGYAKFTTKWDSTSPPIRNYSWTILDSLGHGVISTSGNSAGFSYQFTKGGWYHYILTLYSSSVCMTNYFDSIHVDPLSLFTELQHDTIVCAKSPSVLLKVNINKGTPSYNYKWNTGETTPTKSAIITKDTSFIVTVSDFARCKNSDTVHIKFLNPSLSKPALFVYKCSNSNIQIKSSDISPQVTWTAIIGNKTFPNYSDSSVLTVNDTGIYIATPRNSSICLGVDSFIVHTIPTALSLSDTNVCYGDQIYYRFGGFKEAWIDSGTNWIPLDTVNAISIKSATHLAGYKILFPGRFKNHGTSCIDSNILIIHVNPKPKVKINGTLPEMCAYDHPLYLPDFEDSNHRGGFWTYPPKPGGIVGHYLYPNIVDSTSNIPGFIHNPLHYFYKDKFGCSGEDSTPLIVWPRVNAGPDATAWIECGKYILNNQYVTPRTGGKWTTIPGMPAVSLHYAGDSVFFFPDSVGGFGKYGFIYTYNNPKDSAACFGSDTVFLTLAGRPGISITPIDTLCSNGNTYQINVYPFTGHFEFTDATNPMAVSGPNIYPSIAGLGYHRLRYVIDGSPGNPYCIDTAGIGFYVSPPLLDAGFHTEDSSWQYCSSHAPVKLIPNTPGGVFVGSSTIFNIGPNFYFKPAAANVSCCPTPITITCVTPYDRHKCQSVYSQDIIVVPGPTVDIINDTFICGANNVFTIHGAANNCLGYYWSSPDGNGQMLVLFLARQNPVIF